MIYPVSKIYITQYFGGNAEMYKQVGMAGHNGLDFRVRFADSLNGERPILAVADGVVLEAADQGAKKGYGKFVRLGHEGTSQTVYGHNSKLLVTKGQEVKAGDPIAISGNTGWSFGAHCHFGLRPDGWEKIYHNGFFGYVDPLPYLEGKIPFGAIKSKVENEEFAKKWAGWLIIVPEWNGAVYHVSPKTLKRYPVKVDQATAAKYAATGSWVGMSANDAIKIPEA